MKRESSSRKSDVEIIDWEEKQNFPCNCRINGGQWTGSECENQMPETRVRRKSKLKRHRQWQSDSHSESDEDKGFDTKVKKKEDTTKIQRIMEKIVAMARKQTWRREMLPLCNRLSWERQCPLSHTQPVSQGRVASITKPQHWIGLHDIINCFFFKENEHIFKQELD